MAKILDLRNKQESVVRQPQKPLEKKVIGSSSPTRRNFREGGSGRQQPPEISWEAPSFYFNPQKRYLVLTVVVLALGGGVLLFLNKDTLTATFLLLASLVLILYSSKRPEISKITISQSGIATGNALYYYKDLKSFWIHYDLGLVKELSLESKKWYIPYTKILIENQNPLILRSFLLRFLTEKEHESSLIDIISRKIGI